MDKKAKLFGIVLDLNLAPLSSPREPVAAAEGDDDVLIIEPPRLSLPRRYWAPQLAVTSGTGARANGDGQSCRDVEGETVFCVECRTQSRPRGPLSVAGMNQWRCFKCLLENRGGDRAGNSGSGGAGGRGGGLTLLDINASPPEDMEVDDAGLGGDVAQYQNHGTKVQAGTYSSFPGGPVGSLSAFPNMTWPEKGFHLPNPPNTMGATPNSGSDDIANNRRPSEINSHMGDLRSTYEGRERATSSTSTADHRKTPNELYLEGLEEHVAERNGVLGDGWRVEFVFCNQRLKTIAVWCSPGGSRFESTSDVAHYLGLPTNPSLQSVNIQNGFVSMQNSMLLNQRRKESSWFTRASSSQQRSSIPRNSSPLKSLSSGVESLSQDGFPIQFEDFYLISAGVIDSRPSYRNTNQIWPVGYRSVWHDQMTGSLFVFDITDGGDSGPNFKVHRYPCGIQPIPVGSIVLSRPKREDSEGKEDSTRFGAIDVESMPIQMMLTESSAPSLDDDISSTSIGEPECDSRRGELPSSDSFAQRAGNFTFNILGLRDSIGEFSVEGRSPSSLWERVCETFLHASVEAYNKKGLLQLGCDHCEMYARELENVDSLSKFSHLAGPITNPCVLRSSDEFHVTCDLVAKWLQPDRFGLDAEFVQEIIEQLPGVNSCSGYTLLTKREHPSTPQTVGNGFLQAKRKCLGNLKVDSDGYFGILNGARDHSRHSELRGPLPPGKPICSRLRADLISDALQVWEFSCRFHEVLGLQLSSFQELEDELINPWLGNLNTRETLGTEIQDSRGVFSGSSMEPSQARASCHSTSVCSGIILTSSHGSLLKVLVGELLSKVAAYVDPNFDAGESKSRRGRKKDAEHSAVLKKMKLDMMPVNELTWPEIARRYILAVLSMEGNLDSAEIASRESGKVFHLLRGHGGILSSTEVVALEADAQLLAEATKKIFGVLMARNEAVSTDENETDVAASSQTMDMNNGDVPEWAQVLEPVRKLATNVGARIRKCVYEALEKNPPEWARKRLEHSISKDVYKGNASGPTKRAVVEVLADVSREKLQQKSEKKEKVKTVYTVSDLIMKQCWIVLRKAVCADEDRVFCNLLSRTLRNPNDLNDVEGILGHPTMVSRPLNFRTIDTRLAVGAYGGSHEAFLDDVREVWHNVRTAYGDQSDLIELAETLSQQFEDLYEKEVLTFVEKATGAVSGSESEKERDDMLAHVNNSSVPKAPWEDGICRVCGMDKDDDSVLLCDNCDDGCHRYCLNPPLSVVPAGNWYCPTCVKDKSSSENSASGNQILNQRAKRPYQRKHIGDILEGLAQLANKMELKEYWELTVEQRIFLIKFLCDEAMNSPIIHDHIDQCASKCADLQQKLHSLNSERKILKLKEESLAANIAKMRGNTQCGGEDLALNGLSSVRAHEAELPGDNNVSSFSGGLVQMEDGPRSMDLDDLNDQSCRYSRSYDSTNSQNSNQTNTSSLQEYNAEFGKLKREISCLQESISTAESELLKVAFRKEFLGRDSYGRLYWFFARHDANPWIVANGSLNPETEFGLDNLFPKSTSWMYYDTVTEIEELVNWLDDCDLRERELKEAILQWLSNKSLYANCKRKDLLQGKPASSTIPSGRRGTNLDFPVSNAVRALENKFGPGLEIWANHIKNLDRGSEMIYQGRMCRCECLELFWPSRLHCFSCHKTFSTSEEFNQHVEKCRMVATGPGSSQLAAGSPKQKKMAKNQGVRICSGSSNLPPPFVNEKHDTQSSSFNHPPDPEFPFNLEEILSKFKVENSLKEVIKGIGLIGTNGVVPFLPNRTPYLDDPSLTLVPSRDNNVSNGGQTSVPESQQKLSETDKGEVSEVERMKSRVLSERGQLSSMKGTSSLSIARRSLVRESSLRPKVGRASEVLRFLKIHLLDIDAALPEVALRASRSRLDRRCAWRTFVKSANTLYEMVLALIILEDTIRTDYLKNDWWYWSSPSGAADISTLSALAFRIYTLDSAILYEKPSTNDTAGTSMQDGKPDMEVSPSAVPTNDMKSADQPTKSDSGETSRPRTRMSRRGKIQVVEYSVDTSFVQSNLPASQGHHHLSRTL